MIPYKYILTHPLIKILWLKLSPTNQPTVIFCGHVSSNKQLILGGLIIVHVISWNVQTYRRGKCKVHVILGSAGSVRRVLPTDKCVHGGKRGCTYYMLLQLFTL